MQTILHASGLERRSYVSAIHNAETSESGQEVVTNAVSYKPDAKSCIAHNDQTLEHRFE